MKGTPCKYTGGTFNITGNAKPGGRGTSLPPILSSPIIQNNSSVPARLPCARCNVCTYVRWSVVRLPSPRAGCFIDIHTKTSPPHEDAPPSQLRTMLAGEKCLVHDDGMITTTRDSVK